MAEDLEDYCNWDCSALKLGAELPEDLRFVTEPPKELLCPPSRTILACFLVKLYYNSTTKTCLVPSHQQ